MDKQDKTFLTAVLRSFKVGSVSLTETLAYISKVVRVNRCAGKVEAIAEFRKDLNRKGKNNAYNFSVNQQGKP